MASIEELKAGMILAKDLRDKGGRMLLPAGATLTEAHLPMLRRMGVAEAEVRSCGEGAAEPDEATVERAAAHVLWYFSYVDPDLPAHQEMYRIAVERTARRMASGFEPPDEDARLARNMEHLRDLFLRDEGAPEDIVKHETAVASFPDIYFKIKEVLDKPHASNQDIAKVVGTDVALSARLLKLVNSPFYGFPSAVDSISRAIGLIGVKELSTLALGISTINYFKDIPPELMDMKTFWRHSITCGILAKCLARRIKGLSAERFFTAGLLHDVGRLIEFKKMPYASVQAMLFARSNSVPLVDAENTVLGFDHTEVARLLLKEWKFPASLADVIAGHHDPLHAPDPKGAAVLQAADTLTNALEIASGGLYVAPGLDPGAWELLGVPAGDLPGLVEEFDCQIEEVMQVFVH